MTPLLVFSVISVYFVILLVVAKFTSEKATTEVFFTAKRQSPWFVVAFGMIGASLSGITFISVPGEVGNSGFEYFQMVLGYLLGYLVIGGVLMPLYYRLNLVSIYTYLEKRFGFWAYKSGAFFFLLSRTIGASFRLFLVAGVLQMAIFRDWGIPFWITVLITIVLIWVYTFRGGIKTIVWTDTMQTLFMLLAVLVSMLIILNSLDIKLVDLPGVIVSGDKANVFVWEWKEKRNFFKQFFAGAFITIVMTGLDQDMMQKNLTCKNIGEAQKNMFWFSIILVIANLLFLSLGALLYIYSEQNGITIPEKSDDLFPFLALNHFNTLAGVLFVLGITAAAYSSADSALTSLTTSFCIDFLKFGDQPESYKKQTRIKVHVGFSALIFLVIMIFRAINDESVINSLFIAAGYTYGPLLGLYGFGMFTKLYVRDRWIPLICIASPLLSYIFNLNSEAWFQGYKFGFEILILNGLFTFLGLLLVSKRHAQPS
ncbi:MAG: sodium:solute symporter [Cytophagales bacterium]|nr:sodium:solute symporter [Cytophagales bacterium]